jgi:hypothetical protein
MAYCEQRKQASSPRRTQMFEKILIANRGENGSAAVVSAQPNCLLRAAQAGEFPAENPNV